MKVSLNWLRDYVDIDFSPGDLAERLTMTGTKVESVDQIGANLRDILVARIVALEPHPDRETSLQLVTVALGDRPTQTIVTGAQNIAVGDKVPFAGLGVTLPNGVTLKARPIRGVVSQGMVLADDEMGLGEDHSGIRILDASAPEGRPLSEVLGDAVFDLEITSNRPDCLSVIGVAREIAAFTGKPLRLPDLDLVEGMTATEDLVRVHVDRPDLCPRLTVRAVSGVTIGPSPAHIVARLQACGMRSINNVVDVTNYVMLEYGQPMHPYDADLVVGGALGVRLARTGETLVTLDGQERRLTPDMLIIVDGADKPIGLAGVMGGLATEVTDKTTTLLLELATFHGPTIRATATRLGLRSEASGRFEKGLPTSLPTTAGARAAALIAQVAGGVVTRGVVETGDAGERRRTIALGMKAPERLLGLPVTRDQIVLSLESLGFVVQEQAASRPLAPDNDGFPEVVATEYESGAPVESTPVQLSRPLLLDADGSVESSIEDDGHDESQPVGAAPRALVVVPSWREDVVEEADLVEEVARMVGYDKIPSTLLRGGVPAVEQAKGYTLMNELRAFLPSCGLSEAVTYVLVGDASLERLRGPETALDEGPLSEDEIAALVPNAAAITAAGATYGPIRLQNPLSPERSVMRPTLLAGLLDALSLNLRQGRESVRLFELGRAYFPRVFTQPEPTRQPAVERRTLSVVLSGLREERSWDAPPTPLDFYDLKGIAVAVLAAAGVHGYSVEAAGHPLLHPGRAARLRLLDRKGRPATELAVLGEVHPVVAARFDLRDRALVMEMDLDALAAVATTMRTYADISRYPAVKRDLAVVVPSATPAEDVLRAVRQGGGKLLQSVDVFDVYEGEQVGAGVKSLALSFVLQSLDKTLSDREIDGAVANIERRLGDTVGATVRR